MDFLGRVRPRTALFVCLFGGVAACTVTPTADNDPNEPVGVQTSAEMIDRIGTPNPLPLDKTVTGVWTHSQRVLGFVFEAKVGASIQLTFNGKAGSDAATLASGAALDTVVAVYGPMNGDDHGPLLAQADDVQSAAAQLAALPIAKDGKYVVALSSWDDPGSNGSFQIRASCTGTEFQCRQPLAVAPCTNTTRYVVGGTVIGTETWNECNVVLLEEVHVAAGAVLTINPGVTVKGNYVGTDTYGTVKLVVDGSLQAIGTKTQPIVFTSLTTGWGGVVLAGGSNTLENVYVEKSRTGLDVRAGTNTIRSVSVNSGETGIAFGINATDNTLEHLRVTQVQDGLRFDQGSAAKVTDAVIQGLGTDKGVGVRMDRAAQSSFEQSIVTGFDYGLWLSTTNVAVRDSTVAKNKRGIYVTGANTGVNPSYTCPVNNFTTPPAPPSWGPDPIFTRCDIVKNTEFGVRIDAPELLVIEESNLVDNGIAVRVEANSIHDQSRIVKSNIHGNGQGAQVDAMHIHGLLDISGNYWAQLSDPGLSASWMMAHSRSIPCADSVGTCTGYSSASSCEQYQFPGYSCSGASYNYTCRRSNPNATAQWSSQFKFTGFSPVTLAAGPDAAILSTQVKTARAAL